METASRAACILCLMSHQGRNLEVRVELSLWQRQQNKEKQHIHETKTLNERKQKENRTVTDGTELPLLLLFVLNNNYCSALFIVECIFLGTYHSPLL